MAIAFIAQATGSTSATLPSFTAGDLAIVFAYRNVNGTAITLPAGWTAITNSDSSNQAHRTGYRILVGGDTTTSTWTNATSVEVLLFSGHDPTTPIGASNGTENAGSNQISYPSLTLSVTDGTSWVLGCAGHRAASNANSPGVSGMTTRASSQGRTGFHTAEAVSSFAGGNYDATVSSTFSWLSRVIEILAAGGGGPTNITNLTQSILLKPNLIGGALIQ